MLDAFFSAQQIELLKNFSGVEGKILMVIKHFEIKF